MTGDLVGARPLFEETLAGRTEQLGPTHTKTLTCKMNLAILLIEMGERAEARPLLEEVVAGQTEELGSRHVETANAQTVLAEVLVLEHELDAASVVIEPAIEVLVRRQPTLLRNFIAIATSAVAHKQRRRCDCLLMYLYCRSHSAVTKDKDAVM